MSGLNPSNPYATKLFMISAGPSFHASPLRAAVNTVVLAAGLAVSIMAPASAIDADPAAFKDWRDVMMKNLGKQEGCFHAKYPNPVWEKVQCDDVVQPRSHPVHVKR